MWWESMLMQGLPGESNDKAHFTPNDASTRAHRLDSGVQNCAYFAVQLVIHSF